MKKLLLGLVLPGALFSFAAWAAGSDELWEMKTRMYSGMKVQATPYTACLPKGEAYMPQKSPQEKNCEITEHKVSGVKTTWKMHCTGDNAMDVEGEVTRTADTIKGTMQVVANGKKIKQIISGKRIGTCQAE